MFSSYHKDISNLACKVLIANADNWPVWEDQNLRVAVQETVHKGLMPTTTHQSLYRQPSSVPIPF